jgi:hypothetical protein
MKTFITRLFDSGGNTLIPGMLLIFNVYICTAQPVPLTRYIDATGGHDLNDGKSPQTAWRSLEKINNTTLNPGDSLLFKAGEKWYGALLPAGSGTEGSPIVIDRYGAGPRPEIHGYGLVPNTLSLENQEYWEINNLRITNFEEAVQEEPSRKRGIHIKVADMGPVRHIHLYNLEVDSVNSENSSFNSRYYGGIFFEIAGSEIPTYFDDILIDSCYIHDLSRTGISNTSSWATRTLTTSLGQYIGKDTHGDDRYDNWVPSKNIIVKKNTLKRIAGNGIIIRVADNPLIELNYLDSCGLYISGNAAFCFNTDSALFQYNEACYTVYNEGDTDARGIDSDYRTKNTIIQYNYLHHNEYGGVVATGGSGTSAWLETFNDGTIIRYNILADNKDHILRTSGKLTNLLFHNNVLYTSDTDEHDDIIIVNNGSWGGASAKNSYYYSNIFLHLAANPVFDFGDSYSNQFENNLFFGNRAWNEPEDPHKITEDPMLINPGTKDLNGYMISGDSPAVQAGKVITGHPEKDFFGNPIPPEGPVDIGIHQLSKPVSNRGKTSISGRETSGNIYLIPNPVHDLLTVKCTHLPDKTKQWRVVDCQGKVSRLKGHICSDSDSFTFDIELGNPELETGIYFLGIMFENGLETFHPFIYY